MKTINFLFATFFLSAIFATVGVTLGLHIFTVAFLNAIVTIVLYDIYIGRHTPNVNKS